MNLLCTLSGHTVPTVPLENQGFRFSRCTRCCQDIIRSSTLAGSDWKGVPKGFKIAWRSVDLTVFDHRSRIGATIAATRETVRAVFSVAGIGCAAVCQRTSDRARRTLRRASGSVLSPRAIRVAQPKLLKRRWNFMLHVTIGRDMGFDLNRVVA